MLRSTRLTHPTRLGTNPRHLQTSIGCSLAIPKLHLPRNHSGSPTRRVQKCTSLRVELRCALLAASPTTPGHLRRRRRRRRILTQDQRRWRRLVIYEQKRVRRRAGRARINANAIGNGQAHFLRPCLSIYKHKRIGANVPFTRKPVAINSQGRRSKAMAKHASGQTQSQHGPHSGRRLGLGTLSEAPRNCQRASETSKKPRPNEARVGARRVSDKGGVETNGGASASRRRG